MLFDIDGLVNEALAGIYSGASGTVDASLWQIENRALQQAVTAGFGRVEYGQPNFELANQLRGNASVFSAFKAHREQNELAALLLDPATGKLKSFAQWKKEVQPIIGKYNRNWLRTEYNTAVHRARTAEQFARAQQTRDLYPNLRWTPSRSAHRREAHMPFYNRVWAIDDPFWSTCYPGSLWNCKCGMERTDDPVTDSASTVPNVPAVPGLDRNPVNGELFTGTSPMFQGVSKKEAGAIKGDAGLLYMRDARKRMREWAKKNIPEGGLKLDVKVNEFSQLTLYRKDIKDITAKQHQYAADAYLLCDQLDKIVNNAEYMGWTPDKLIRLADGTKRQKHLDVEKWMYYRFKLNDRYSYLNIKLINDEYRVYCIIDDTGFNESIIKYPAKK